jgi:hypothetical protein
MDQLRPFLSSRKFANVPVIPQQAYDAVFPVHGPPVDRFELPTFWFVA